MDADPPHTGVKIPRLITLACICHPSGQDGLCVVCVWAAEDEVYATRHLADAEQADDDAGPWWDDVAAAEARAEALMLEDD